MIIDNEEYQVLQTEYTKSNDQEFCNICILNSLNLHQRIISLIEEITLNILVTKKYTFLSCNTTHGGYIPIKLASLFSDVYIQTQNNLHRENILTNIKQHLITNITVIDEEVNTDIVFNSKELLSSVSKIIITSVNFFESKNDFSSSYYRYSISDSDLFVYVYRDFNAAFTKYFSYFMRPNYILDYDNLIHYTMIVKNAGDGLRDILTHNLPYIDRWTILDTGSTDNTISIIKDVLKKKKGNLYEEPFINFRDSRNRCLDLAGFCCKFIIMIDDTYKIQGNLRQFLQTVRGDQITDSFSLFIKSFDTEYGSNRIIKASSKLRYIYRIHEVISPENNLNVIIPFEHSYIEDVSSIYMIERSFNRKQQDLVFLNEELLENPDDPRSLYYIAQTYYLLKQYQKAYDYFLLRVNHKNDGFIQEKIDACFEAARIANFQLHLDWDTCLKLYLEAYDMDKTRPDSLYFIGIHYFQIDNIDFAYKYFKDAFTIPYPHHCQYSLKPTLSFYFLPQFLAQVAFKVKDYQLVLKCVQLFIKKNKTNEASSVFTTMKCYEKLIIHFNESQKYPSNLTQIHKNNIIFLADGGFTPWTGADIMNKGVGGSETFIIEIAQNLKIIDPSFNIFVFCRCSKQEIFNNVQYLDISCIHNFIQNNFISNIIVSRYPEYLLFLYEHKNVKDVHLIFHDIIPEGEIIINNPKLKNIISLTKFHKLVFDNMFPTLNHLTTIFSYGINTLFLCKNRKEQKIPLRFIYSSFPDRGLLQLLKMWKNILNKYPSASLVIHCDLENEWVNTHHSNIIEQIKILLKEMEFNYGIQFLGWVNKALLAESWLQADIWFYPCVFIETFCLTALEAALSKTLIVTSNLGSLVDVVKSGIIIEGDASTINWQNKALQNLFQIIEDEKRKKLIVDENFMWCYNLLWENRALEFIQYLQTN